MWNLKRPWMYTQNRSRLTDIENQPAVAELPHLPACISYKCPMWITASCLSLCLSLNSFCAEIQRTWASVSPDTSYWQLHQVAEVNCMLLVSMQTPDPLESEGWWCWPPLTSPLTNQKSVHKLITPSLGHCYKTPHYSLQEGTHSFEGISPLWPPLPGKAIKLSFSTSLPPIQKKEQTSGAWKRGGTN